MSTPFLVDIRPGAFSSYPDNLTAVGSTLFFGADNGVNGQELWKSDGTAAGTVLMGLRQKTNRCPKSLKPRYIKENHKLRLTLCPVMV